MDATGVTLAILDGWHEWRFSPWLVVALVLGGLWVIAHWFSRWTLRLAAVVAILLGVVVLSRTSTPEERDARPCADADGLLDKGHLRAARIAYLEMLSGPRVRVGGADDPPRFTGRYTDVDELTGEACARQGLQEVLRAWTPDVVACRSADRLRDAGRSDEAEAAYVRLLRDTDRDGYDCAHMGLDDLEAASAESDDVTFDEVVVERGENFAERLTEAFPGVPVAPGPVTWVVLLVVVVCLWRRLEIINAGRELAPVTATEVTSDPKSPSGVPDEKHAGGAADQPVTPGQPPTTSSNDGSGSAGPGHIEGTRGTTPEAISATQLRQRLARAGLAIPTPVPGAAPTLSTLVADTPFTDGWIGRLAGFLVGLAFPLRGVRMTATQVARHGPSGEGNDGIAVEVNLIRSGDPLFIHTFWGSCPHDAMDKAAYGVAQRLTARCPALPPWRHWGDEDSDALYHYQRGLEHVARRALDAGTRELRRAAVAAPGNAAIQVELAMVAEQEQDYLRAIEIYLATVDRYPHLPIARYRLAAALTLVECWVARFERDDCMARRLRTALPEGTRERVKPESNPRRAVLIDAFLDLASKQIAYLRNDLRWHRIVWRSLRRSTRPAALRFVRHPYMHRHAARRALAGSKLAIRIRRAARSKRDPKHVAKLRSKARRVARWASGPQAHYNAACCYALLLPKPPTLTGGGARTTAWAREDKCEQDASAAVRALGEAVSDPSRPFAVGGLPWLLYDDPDLTHLRRHPAFADWVEARFGERPEPDPDWGATLRSRFGTLHRCAAEIVDQWPAGSARSNGDLAAAEKGRWSALADWASSPKSAWAAEGLKRAFDAEVDSNGPESLDAVDVEALEEAWRWIVPVVIDVRDHWTSRPSEPTGLFSPKASRRVWRALSLYTSHPDSGRRRCLLEGALGKGPLVDAVGTTSSVTSAPSHTGG